MAHRIRHFINGRFVEGEGAPLVTLNPATGEVLGEGRAASPAQVDAAVAGARASFPAWARKDGRERGRILAEAARQLRARNEELAALEVDDTGKPVSEAATVDVLSGADALEYFGGLAATLHGTHHEFSTAFAYTRREPLGVCAGIGAWNYPLQIACWKSAPALACGNAMIFKPAELTPLSALALAEVFRKAGLPDGVFQVLQGEAEIGQALVRHDGVAKVSLTGEVTTGRQVMADGAATLKAITLELGGKSPLIVFPDADLDAAVAGAMVGNFYTQGEVCSHGTRVFVHESLAAPFTSRLVEKTRALRVGDPRDPATQVGALIGEAHLEKVLGFIRGAEGQGARRLVGGERLQPPGRCRNGAFLSPTVFAECQDDMTHVREEIFGPVLSLLTFRDEGEVVERANRTPFGLAAGIFTRDLTRAHRVAAALEAGVVWVNNYNVTPVEVPFGGVKQSGIGRENGLAVLDHYTQLKTVYVEMKGIDSPY